MQVKLTTLSVNAEHGTSVFNKFLANLLISIPTVMGIYHLMVLTSKSSVLTADDRTTYVCVLSLEIKVLLIGIGVSIVTHIDNQLAFAVIINVHGLDQLNGDSLKREKIRSKSLTASPTLLILLVKGGDLIPLLIVVNSNFQPLLM
jgi:hypothetical protein